MNIFRNEFKYVLTSYNESRNVILVKQKVPAAGGKTSTRLSHDIKMEKHDFILVLNIKEAPYYRSPENKGYLRT